MSKRLDLTKNINDESDSEENLPATNITKVKSNNYHVKHHNRSTICESSFNSDQSDIEMEASNEILNNQNPLITEPPFIFEQDIPMQHEQDNLNNDSNSDISLNSEM
jgi:hypothetical protein